MKFNDKFTCLGSIINFTLDDTVDANIIVSKASKSVGELSFIWTDDNMHLIIIVKLQNAAPAKFAIMGSRELE